MRTTCCALLLSAATFALAAPYQIPDAELLLAGDFAQHAGYSASASTLDGRLDAPGPGVAFLLTLRGPASGLMAIDDPWQTNSAAGFGWDPVLHHWTSLADYDGLRMQVKYISGPPESTIDLSLILNTGLCGPSGFPNGSDGLGDPTNDTFWAGPWTPLALGETRTLVLDFDEARAWNITDNKDPHTGGGLSWLSGELYAINERDLNEISNIGIQIANFGDAALDQPIVLLLNAPAPVPEPATLSLLGLGALALLRRRRRAASHRR